MAVLISNYSPNSYIVPPFSDGTISEFVAVHIQFVLRLVRHWVLRRYQITFLSVSLALHFCVIASDIRYNFTAGHKLAKSVTSPPIRSRGDYQTIA
jgi:hypothetical protein